MKEYFRVGVIASAHGIRGEVNVYPTTEDPQRFTLLESVLLGTEGAMKPLGITSVKFFKKMVILKLQGIDDRNAAELLRGRELYVHRDDAIALEEGEHYVADLIGLAVYTDEGERFGEITDVMKTGANDVYVVRGEEGREYLLPVIPECILDTDIENGRVTVHLMDGLLDL